MATKHDVIARYRKGVVGMALSGVTVLLLAGCGSLFDSPPGEEHVNEEAALKGLEKAASYTPESAADEAGGIAADKSRNAAQQGAADNMKRKKDDPDSKSKDGKDEVVKWETPRLTFERFRADMPQLAVLGLEEATFLLDDKQIELGKPTRAGRIALIPPGNHRLQVKCPSDPPFSADFYLVKDDRAVLRGRCSSVRRAVTGEGKR